MLKLLFKALNPPSSDGIVPAYATEALNAKHVTVITIPRINFERDAIVGFADGHTSVVVDFVSHIQLISCRPEKLPYPMANPARGLLNRESNSHSMAAHPPFPTLLVINNNILLLTGEIKI